MHDIARRRVIRYEVASLRNFAAIVPLALGSALAQTAAAPSFDVAYVKALSLEPHGGDLEVTPTSICLYATPWASYSGGRTRGSVCQEWREGDPLPLSLKPSPRPERIRVAEPGP